MEIQPRVIKPGEVFNITNTKAIGPQFGFVNWGIEPFAFDLSENAGLVLPVHACVGFDAFATRNTGKLVSSLEFRTHSDEMEQQGLLAVRRWKRLGIPLSEKTLRADVAEVLPRLRMHLMDPRGRREFAPEMAELECGGLKIRTLSEVTDEQVPTFRFRFIVAD